MKINLIVIGIIVLFAFLYETYDIYSPANITSNNVTNTELKTNKSSWKDVPDFSFTTLKGKNLNLHDFEGKVVVVSFWATWCLTCVKAFPGDIEAMKKYDGEVIFIAPSSDSKVNDIQRFIRKQTAEIQTILKEPYIHIFLDENREITRNIFHTERYPETIIISKDMKMVRKLVGEVIWDSPEVVSLIEGLL